MGAARSATARRFVTECRLDDQIPGLMALLTVRNHFYHYNFKRFCWREGVFLRDPNHPTRWR